MTDSFTQLIADLRHIASHSSDRGTDLVAIIARLQALTATPAKGTDPQHG